jgi:hypothetical protein
VFDLETSTMRRAGSQLGHSATEEGKELTLVNGGILLRNMSGFRERYPVIARQSVTTREFCSTPLPPTHTGSSCWNDVSFHLN